MLGLTQLSNYLTLKGSFLAVSKPNLQLNMRLKALAEIYKMHSLAPFSWDPSKLNFLFEDRFKHLLIFANFYEICQHFSRIRRFSCRFLSEFHEIL